MTLTMAKRSFAFAVGAVVVAVLVSSPGRAEVGVGWKGGVFIEDQDAGYSIKFGGRIMHDWSWISPDEDLDAAFSNKFTDGTEFRRTRFYSSGTIYHVVFYKAQYDYAADGTSEFKDVYVGLKNIPMLGSIQAGQMYEPFGLEEQTTSNVITFLERALTSNIVPSRKSGVMFARELSSKRATFSGGVFRNSDDYGRAEDHDYNVTARVTGVPVMQDEGKKLVHVGAAVSVREPAGDDYSISARASTHISPRLVGTKTDSLESLEFTERVVLFGGEAAAIYGPASLQGEFMVAATSNDTLDDPSFTSFYVQASYLITGESREYKGGLMGGVKPAKNFDGEGGAGAWELAARFAGIDLEDGAVTGGELNDVTVGLNWYLNPNARIMFNYVYADLKDVGTSNAFMTRFQVAF